MTIFHGNFYLLSEFLSEICWEEVAKEYFSYFIYLCAAVFHQWLHQYCPLKRQMSLACRRNTYLWRHPINNIAMVSKSQLQGCQTASALRLIMQCSKTGRKTSSVASAVWHGAPSCWNQMLPISSSSIFVNKNSFNMARQRSPLTPIFAHFRRKIVPIIPLDQNPHQTVTQCFNVCVRVFCAPKATILLVYIPAQIKMSFIWKDEFFLP